MPRSTKTIRVLPIPNEPLRYYVESWTNPQKPHLVDLTENEGNGECSCTDFATRRAPAIKAGVPLFTSATSCRHIRAARKHFTIFTLRDIAKSLNTPKS